MTPAFEAEIKPIGNSTDRIGGWNLPSLDLLSSDKGTPQVGEMPPEGATAFLVYKPKHLSGPALETVLREFSDHLKTSGLENQGLFNAIQNMRWIDKNDSLVFLAMANH